ncbi:hypothetical protein PDL71_18055 [Lacibacter sp. MH-610]|uniref:hypothetical protein n=1 Tax=Lacibacter sp. MH-610 TaxID=3020883 RepID=UPI0038926284
MKSVSLLIIQLFLTISFSFAQFSPASVTLKDGKTISGFVKSLKNHMNPRDLVIFPGKEEKDAQPVPFETLKELVIDGEGTFIPVSAKKYTHELEFSRVANVSEAENKEAFVIQSLLVRVLWKGEKLSLYSYKETYRSNYFIQEPGKEIVTLRYVRSLDPVNKTSIKEYRYYLNQLIPYVSGNKKLESKLETTGWNDNSLTKLCKEINTNTTPYALYTGRGSETSQLIIGAGVNFASFKAVDKNDFQSFYQNMSFNTSTGPVFFIGSELGFEEKGKNFKFLVLLSAFPFSTTGTSIWNNNGTSTKAEIELKGFSLLFSPSLKYKLGNHVQVGAGVQLNITSFRQVNFNDLPNWARKGIFDPFGPSTAGTPLAFHPFAQIDVLLTKKHGLSFSYALSQNNLKFYDDARLKMGYASIVYQYRLRLKKD